MTEAPSLNKVIDELNETHVNVKNLIYDFDYFHMDEVMETIYRCLPTIQPEKNAEIIKILKRLKESLHDLDKKKIKEHKKELMKFLEGAKK